MRKNHLVSTLINAESFLLCNGWNEDQIYLTEGSIEFITGEFIDDNMDLSDKWMTAVIGEKISFTGSMVDNTLAVYID